MKKLISAILIFSMLFTMTSTAFAASSTLDSKADGIEYLTVYDEENMTVQAVQRNISTGENVYGPVISVVADIDSQESIDKTSSRATKIHQDTFLNFEYDYWLTSPQEWNLERPNGVFSQYYFKVYKNDSNDDELSTWKSDVDALNAQEFVVIIAFGASVFELARAAITSHAAIASGGVLTAAAIDSIRNAVIAVAGTAVGIGYLCTTYNDCVLSYIDVFENTDNIHY